MILARHEAICKSETMDLDAPAVAFGVGANPLEFPGGECVVEGRVEAVDHDRPEGHADLVLESVGGLDQLVDRGLLGQGELAAEIIENAARKVLKGYIPPIAIVEDTNFDQATAIIEYEETANIGNLKTNAQFLYELDCPDRKIRRLSIHVRVGGKDVFDEKQSDWEYTPPETNGARLLTMLCLKR